MIQCNSGHFFDESKHSSCPYCAVPLDRLLDGDRSVIVASKFGRRSFE
jgi:hypothetical protein